MGRNDDFVALFVAETDQQKALVRELVGRVRKHWADDSGCPLPKCPSAGLLRLLNDAHPGNVIQLLMAALVMLAEHPSGPTHAPGWSVTDVLDVRHDFIGPESAMRYALEQAMTERGTTVESPTGDRWVVMRRHHNITVFAARKVGS